MPVAAVVADQRSGATARGRAVGRVKTYPNFADTTEEAVAFYRQVLDTEPGPITRMRDIPAPPGAPARPRSEHDAVMHVELETSAVPC